jgi:paraquat-inducible protein A
LVDIAQVDVGGAIYALGALMLAMCATDAVLDHEAIWDRLEQRGQTAAPIPTVEGGELVGCHCCGIVVPMRRDCPRCGSRLHRRKPNSVAHTWALLAAAAILYIPANALPVMTVISLGQGSPNTILSGVMELATDGMWPLAALVFVASITVPVLKLFGLAYLLITTQLGRRKALRERTFIYRVIDSIGRWSMIDVFMISILTALVRMGTIASVYPGPGVLSFCAVVIITIFAAQSFDPRLIWDAAERARSRSRGAAVAAPAQAERLA